MAGAFAVYQQLSNANKLVYERIKEGLVSALPSNRSYAYEQFTARKLSDVESLDVFVADSRRCLEASVTLACLCFCGPAYLTLPAASNRLVHIWNPWTLASS